MGDSQPSRGNIEEEVTGVVEAAKELQESAATHISRSNNEEQALRQRAVSLDSNILRLSSLVHSLLDNHGIDHKSAEKVCAFS